LVAVTKTSVIIPTHNRKDSLLRTMDSLRQQTFPMDMFEAIVVDDGSTDGTQIISSQRFPFTLSYLYQKNQGATVARNYGATISQAEILVFIDDDVTISPQTLAALVETCYQGTKVLVTGTLNWNSSVIASMYTAFMLRSSSNSNHSHNDTYLHFIDCNTELLACKRKDFLDLGMLQDPTEGRGWPNWDDVDFGYRAHLNGFRLLQSSKAFAEHWDHSIADWTLACQRWYRAGKSAVWLFRRHQELQMHIPMLYDKTPPAWGQDSPMLIARKMARYFASSSRVMGSIEKLVIILEQRYPSPFILQRLYYWLHGGYMFRGYRDGLRELELIGARK